MISEIKKEIDKAKNIVITGHISPDGDCIGAAIALKYILQEYDSNKNVSVIIDYELPNYLNEMEYLPEIIKETDDEIDLLISVDVATKDRLAIKEKYIDSAKMRINIDHHISNTKYFDINYIKNKSSASEMMYEFLDLLNVKLNKKIATYMYLGIINDTGNFRHKNVESSTFLIASELIKTGIDINQIYFTLFSKSMKKAEIFSKSIIDGYYDEKNKFMFYYLSQEEIMKNNYSNDDIDGVSEYMLTIKGVELALFIKQISVDKIKGSFRSKVVDVNKLASLFNGGGHKLAAGFLTDKSNYEILKIVLENL